MSEYVYVAELVVYDPTIPGTTTLRYATKGFVTSPSDTPASTFYDGRIKQPALLNRSIYQDGKTQGRSRASLGDLVLANDDGALDGLIDFGFDGREITIRRGLPGAAYPAGYATVLVTTMEQVEVNLSVVTVRLRDRQLELDKPLQATKYLGNNALPAGLEGGEELKGKPKPITYGRARNVSAVLVNASKLIYQVNDGAVASIEARDNGIPLANSFGTWENTLDPFGADICYSITRGPDKFVAVGGSGKLFTSTDGSSWTSRTSSFGATDTIRKVVYSTDLSLYIAVGYSTAPVGKIATSPDGITWTQRTVAGSPLHLYAVAAGGGKVVVVGDKSGPAAYAARSTNGTAWTESTLPTSTAASFGVGYGAGLWLMHLFNSGAATATGIASSPDAVTWTQRTLPDIGGNVTAILRASDGKYYAATALGELYNSPDGITWTPRAPDLFGTIWDMAETQQGLIAVGLSNNVGLIATLGFNDPEWTIWASPGGANEDVFAVAVNGATVIIGTENGQTFTANRGTTYGSLANLEDDTLAPKPGTIGVYAAGGMFRLGSPPAGQITADVVQGAAAANRTAGQIWKAILERVGMVSGSDFSAADITALDTANNAEIGFYSDHELQASEALDLVAGTVGAWWGADQVGVFRIERLVDPAGSAVLTFTEHDIARDSLVREVLRDPGRGIPNWRTILRYARNYTVQPSGLAGGVSAVRRSELAAEWKETTAEDAAVKTKHLLAPEIIEETLFANKTDADAEVARRQTLKGTRRDFFRFRVQLNSETAALDLGDIVDITHPRFGFIAGIKCLILGIEHDAEREELNLAVWGRVYVVILLYAAQLAGIWGWTETPYGQAGLIADENGIAYVDEAQIPGVLQAMRINDQVVFL